MLDEEIWHARRQVDCGRGSHRSAVVVGSDRYVISFRQYGDAPRAANAPVSNIRPHDVDESLAQERLEHARIADPAPEPQWCDGFAGDLAHCFDIGHRT